MAFGNSPLGLENQPDDGGRERWLYGAIAPLPISGIAMLWIVSRQADLHDKAGTVLRGTDAVALGITALFLALFLHFHFFWGLSENPKLRRYAVGGKIVSSLGLFISMLYMIWCLLRLFML